MARRRAAVRLGTVGVLMFVGAWIFAVTTFSQAGTGVFCQGEEVDPAFVGNQFDNILDGTPTKDVMYGGGGDD